MQEVDQGLFTKSLRHMPCQLPMMLVKVREVTPVHITDHVNHTHAQRDGSWEGLLVLPSVDGHFYEVASYYEHTPYAQARKRFDRLTFACEGGWEVGRLLKQSYHQLPLA